MSKTIGVLTAEHVAVGVVENHAIVSPLRRYPEDADPEALVGLPVDDIVRCMSEQIVAAANGDTVAAIGVGFPGLIRNGVVEDSPNLQQLKGTPLQSALSDALQRQGIHAPVALFNDADITAAGVAATLGQLDRFLRVWTLGNGIGYGRYPCIPGAWESGHMVVTLDPKENYCGCGGVGHLEGIMGTRAMRLRFLDLEPEEVFAEAAAGDARCAAFVRTWHRALAAATASCVHTEGPGKFYITGPNARWVDTSLLSELLSEMVKMTPLQGSAFHVVPTSDELGIIGAAVNANLAAGA